MEDRQIRWRSPVVWAAIFAQALTVLVALNIVSVSQSEAVNDAVAALLQLLVVFGVLNNPTDGEHF